MEEVAQVNIRNPTGNEGAYTLNFINGQYLWNILFYPIDQDRVYQADYA